MLVETEAKYQFLKVFKEKDVIVMGLAPTNKYQHEILKHIKQASTFQNASKGNLFAVTEQYKESLQIQFDEIQMHLNKLLADQLISSVISLEYDAVAKEMIAKILRSLILSGLTAINSFSTTYYISTSFE